MLDSSLMTAIPLTEGLKPGGQIIINTAQSADAFPIKGAKNPKISTVDCSSIALKYGLGNKEAPIVNTTILAPWQGPRVWCRSNRSWRASGKRPIKSKENAEAAREAYDRLGGQEAT